MEGINVARKNPLDKIAEKALSSIKDPRSTADRLYTQAKGAGSTARQVADRVGRTAMAKAAETAGTLSERRAARRAGRRGPGLRPVPDVNEPAGPVQDFQRTEPAPAEPARAEPTPAEPTKQPEATEEEPPGASTSVQPTAQQEPAAPAASASPATPADVAKAVQKNGSPKPTAGTGPGDKLPPRKKTEPSKPAAKKSSSKKSGSAAKKSASTATSKKSTGSTSKSTGSTSKSTGSAKKNAGGSTAKKQTPPPATDA